MNQSLNKRWLQVVMTIVPIALAGLILEAPFAWRALRTRTPGDIRLAAVFGVVQLLVWVCFAIDQSHGGRMDNVTGILVWASAFVAAFTAAWVYRPLSKVEQAEQNTGRSGSSYL